MVYQHNHVTVIQEIYIQQIHFPLVVCVCVCPPNTLKCVCRWLHSVKNHLVPGLNWLPEFQ